MFRRKLNKYDSVTQVINSPSKSSKKSTRAWHQKKRYKFLRNLAAGFIINAGVKRMLSNQGSMRNNTEYYGGPTVDVTARRV